MATEFREKWRQNFGNSHRIPVLGSVRHSNGSIRVLALSLQPYLDGTYDWHGLFKDMPTCLENLLTPDQIISCEQFLAIPRTEILQEWQRQG